MNANGENNKLDLSDGDRASLIANITWIAEQAVAHMTSDKDGGKIDLDRDISMLDNFMSGDKTPFHDVDLSPSERVLTITSYLSEQLRLCIAFKLKSGRSRFPSSKEMNEVFAGFGPLNSFASRVSMSSILGLLTDDVKNDLRILKNVRNRIAHDLKPMSFDDEFVAASCKRLAMAHPEDRLAKNRNESFFMGASLRIAQYLMFVVFVSIEQSYVLRGHVSEIFPAALRRWEKNMKKSGVLKDDIKT